MGVFILDLHIYVGNYMGVGSWGLGGWGVGGLVILISIPAELLVGWWSHLEYVPVNRIQHI